MEIRLIRGTTLTLYVSVKPSGSDSEFIPEPDDVFRFGVKKNSFEESYVINRSYASTAYDTDNGYLAIELKPVDTISLKCGDYAFDIGLERGDDYYTLIGPSKLTILPNITAWSGEPPEIN